ncbi:hypothetical protein J5N97_016022 [Dioscorea zingiberensis]|uniref:Uncharacterized protein n=1 Tax=Dioscorea zingiberensis TaxID=325984 RepID=A0A9D5HF98_9LILI|nr:hypothetical protein J5N97_016022 [Dioscorea zingiberensis]
MNFSEGWRELWSVGSTFAAPNLIVSQSSCPLLFEASSSPITLLSSRSLSVSPPPSPSPSPSSIISSLRCSKSPSTLLLFFPSGDNSHSISYLSISFRDPQKPQASGLFLQCDGFKHPFHRISSISVAPVIPAFDCDESPSSGTIIEGFLIATTMFSVNWFRIETRILESGTERPLLVPVAKHGFRSSVVHACWNPHFQEESAVLLENGELCWFNLNTRKGGRVRVMLDEQDPGEWLGCVYGWQPWILIVGCSKAVVIVNLRAENGAKPTVLVKAEVEGLVLAFCKAGFSDSHVSVVTERRLLLFDALLPPMVPVLMWDHVLDHPNYVSMLRLSELGPLKEDQCALESGFATIVGSFSNDSFNLFCYVLSGSGGVIGNTSFNAVGLPTSLVLSGKQCGSGEKLFKYQLASDELPHGMEWQEMRDRVADFFILPHDMFKVDSKDDTVSGFGLIRLMTSGKLELQMYNVSSDLPSNKSAGGKDVPVKTEDFSLCSKNSEDIEVSTTYRYLKLQNFNLCLNGKLSNTMFTSDPQVNKKHPVHLDIKDVDNCSQRFASREAVDVKTISFKDLASCNQSTCTGTYSSRRTIKKEPSDMDNHVDSSQGVRLEIFEVGTEHLEFAPISRVFLPVEDRIYKCLERQFSKWLDELHPCSDKWILLVCCSDVDATLLACVAFSCPNLEVFEISTTGTAANWMTRDELGRFVADKHCLSILKVEGCTNLGSLNLFSSSLSTLWLSDLYCMSKMVINCPNLKELSLDFSQQENDSTDFISMMDSLGRTCPRGLCMLSLVLGSNITDASVAAIVSCYASLEMLDLSGISDNGIGMICNAFPQTLSRFLLSLCPNMTSSGIQFATAKLPHLQLIDCGMSLCDFSSRNDSLEDIAEIGQTHRSQKSGTRTHPIYQKLIIKHGRLKKLSLWGCSGLDVFDKLTEKDNHLPSKRLADGSKRVQAPNFILQRCSDKLILLVCCSDVDATLLACVAFSCPNLEVFEISTTRTAVNWMTGGLCMFSLVLGSSITDASVAAIVSCYASLEMLDLSGLSRLLLALCRNITSSGIQFATAQLPVPHLQLIDCGMSLWDFSSRNDSLEGITEIGQTHRSQKSNTRTYTIYQKLIIKHGRLKKPSLWGCLELNDLNLNSCTNLHSESLLLQCPNLESIHASGCQDLLIGALQDQVFDKLTEKYNRLPSKRLADGSQRVQVPNFILQPSNNKQKRPG